MALQQLVSSAVPDAPEELVPSDHNESGLPAERFDVYFELLEPLDRVRLDRDTHPEGDLLYHSLQVFELACEAMPC